jgi:hypothetical protein
MKKLAVWLLLAPALVLAGSGFDGTWKMRPETLKVTGIARRELIAGGFYSCANCMPPIERIKADGSDQKVSGHDDYDTLAVKVRDRRSVEMTYKRQGQLVQVDTRTLAADGRTLTGRYTDYSGASPASAAFTEKRVAAAPPGAHALSGSWLQTGLFEPNAAFASVSYQMTDDSFGMQSNGRHYQAKFDGREYPMEGDPAGTTVNVRRLSPNAVLETDLRNGVVTRVIRLGVSADGAMLTVTDRDLKRATVSTLSFARE